jgi:hypothetical protein
MTDEEVVAYLRARVSMQVESHVARLGLAMEFPKMKSLANYALRAMLRKQVEDFVTFDYVQEAVLNGPTKQNKAG